MMLRRAAETRSATIDLMRQFILICASILIAAGAFAEGSESVVITYYGTSWQTNGVEEEDCDHNYSSSGLLVGHWKVLEYQSCTMSGGWTEYYERCGGQWVQRSGPTQQCGTNYQIDTTYYGSCPISGQRRGAEQTTCDGGYTSSGTLDGEIKSVHRFNCDDRIFEPTQYFLKCSWWTEVESGNDCACPN